MRYFRYLPQVDYCGELAVNILARGKVREMVKNNIVTYHPYFLTDNDRPDIVSDKYYGDPDHVWLLFYANDIYDPHFDWPLTHTDFLAYMEGKYGDVEATLTTTHHYELLEHITDVPLCEPLIIDEETFLATPTEHTRVVTIYDYEESLNDEKRNVKIIDSLYLSQITKELRRLF